ncbi:MAG: hypothetical protein J1E62_05295 [Lachnospiraceae bacterium]|nr:hypothetical protein [Lachnospiraceae bacterium]
MKRQIRRSVFETNSSAVHSLIVTKNNDYFSENEVRDNFKFLWGKPVKWSYEDMTFPIEFQVLTSLYDKARYVLALMCRQIGDNVYEEVNTVIRSYVPDFSGFEFETLDLPNGLVEENLIDFLQKEDITITEFLTNKRYVVIVDGDHDDCDYNRLKKSGLFNKEMVEREYIGEDF